METKYKYIVAWEGKLETVSASCEADAAKAAAKVWKADWIQVLAFGQIRRLSRIR